MSTPTPDQRALMHALAKEQGVERAEYLHLAFLVSGRRVTTTSDLTVEEMSRLIDRLLDPDPQPPLEEG